MFVFILLIILLVVQGQVVRNRNAYLILAFVELTLVSGFRLPVLDIGSDTEKYCDLYSQYKYFSWSDFASFHSEIGFDFLCYILYGISSSPKFLVFSTQLLMNASILYVIKKKSNIAWLSVVLYITLMFYFSAMNLMRFCLSISILLFTIEPVKNRKFLKFFFLLLVAISLHFSSIIFLPLYFLYPLRCNMKNCLIVSIPILGLSISLMTVFSILLLISPHYAAYGTDGEFYSSSFANILIFALNLFCLLFIIKNNNTSPIFYRGDDKFFFWCIFLSVVFALVGIKIMMAVRFVWLFSIFEVIMLPNVISRIINYTKRLRWIFVWLLITILQVVVILTFRPEWYGILPYKNWLFN